jgi:hypothetical protein
MPFKPGEDVTALMTAAPAAGQDVTAQMNAPTYQPRNILAEGRAAAATDKMSESDYGKLQDPASLSHWFNTELKPMLEKVARPETISDIAALLVPDAAGVVTGARAAFRGAGAAAESTGKALEAMGASRVAQRVGTYGAGYAALSGNLGKAAIAAGAPPALTGAGKVLQSGGRFLQEFGARPVADVAPAAAETPSALTARLTAENAAAHGNVKPDLAATLQAPPEAPVAPQAQPPTAAPVATPAPTSPAPGARPTPSAPMSTPSAFQAALKAFAEAKEVPRPAEVNNVQMLIKRGVAPDQALQTVIGNRPPAPMDPAAELARRLGTPTEAEMNADMLQRAVKGQKSLMPKYGVQQ